MKRLILILIGLTLSHLSFAQLYPERREIRRGNRAWERENYVEAEGRYTGALAKNPASWEAAFNLGGAIFRQGRFEEAEQRFGALGQHVTDPVQGSQAAYNQGNAQVRQYRNTYNREKLTQALESYKQSLRLNPGDQEAKFNLAYVQKLLEKDEGGGGGDQNQDQNQPNPDQGQDQQNSGGGINRQEAEQMLDALAGSEESAREKMERKSAAASRSGKNW
jgi:tetratricopeptide (TPR) repeat protein